MSALFCISLCRCCSLHSCNSAWFARLLRSRRPVRQVTPQNRGHGGSGSSKGGKDPAIDALVYSMPMDSAYQFADASTYVGSSGTQATVSGGTGGALLPTTNDLLTAFMPGCDFSGSRSGSRSGGNTSDGGSGAGGPFAPVPLRAGLSQHGLPRRNGGASPHLQQQQGGGRQWSTPLSASALPDVGSPGPLMNADSLSYPGRGAPSPALPSSLSLGGTGLPTLAALQAGMAAGAPCPDEQSDGRNNQQSLEPWQHQGGVQQVLLPPQQQQQHHQVQSQQRVAPAPAAPAQAAARPGYAQQESNRDLRASAFSAPLPSPAPPLLPLQPLQQQPQEFGSAPLHSASPGPFVQLQLQQQQHQQSQVPTQQVAPQQPVLQQQTQQVQQLLQQTQQHAPPQQQQQQQQQRFPVNGATQAVPGAISNNGVGVSQEAWQQMQMRQWALAQQMYGMSALSGGGAAPAGYGWMSQQLSLPQAAPQASGQQLQQQPGPLPSVLQPAPGLQAPQVGAEPVHMGLHGYAQQQQAVMMQHLQMQQMQTMWTMQQAAAAGGRAQLPLQGGPFFPGGAYMPQMGMGAVGWGQAQAAVTQQVMIMQHQQQLMQQAHLQQSAAAAAQQQQSAVTQPGQGPAPQTHPQPPPDSQPLAHSGVIAPLPYIPDSLLLPERRTYGMLESLLPWRVLHPCHLKSRRRLLWHSLGATPTAS